MTDKVPIRTVFDSSGNATGLAEFQSGETVGHIHGGTGLSSLGSAGQVLKVNAAGNAIEFGSGFSTASGDITLDSAADIILDADGADIILKDGGTEFGRFVNNSGELRISSGSSTTTNITMSGANTTIAGNLTVTGTTEGDGNITIGDAATDTVTFNGTISGNLVFEGSTGDSFETTLAPGNPSADVTITLPSSASDTLVGKATTDTLTNKSIDLANNTITGSLAEFNSALQSESFVSLTGSETLTNKTLTSPDIGTSIELLARAEARFQDASGGQFVALEAPATVSSSFVLTLPAADGSAGQFLKTDGSGALSFDTVSSAADDLTAGDAAINLTTTSGNITIDAQANDSDIIFKGTDGSSDTTFLTIDGSAAGAAAFNDAVTATSFTSTGASTFDGVNITEDGTIVFEGASNNSFETTLTVTDPTADRTITFPNETFKVASYANKATLDGDGSDTTISVAAGYDVDQFFVTINGIVQEPTEDFTYSGSTITLDAAPASGDRVVVRY